MDYISDSDGCPTAGSPIRKAGKGGPAGTGTPLNFTSNPPMVSIILLFLPANQLYEHKKADSGNGCLAGFCRL